MRLMRRHLHLFFVNPGNWIISILSVIVVLALYFLFIRDFTIDAMQNFQVNRHYIELYIDLIMVSGLLVVVNATSCLSICAIFVKDKAQHMINDFLVAPISRTYVYFSYVLAACAISFLVTFLAFVFIGVWFFVEYEFILNLYRVTIMTALILCASMVSSFMLFLFSLAFKSINAFASFNNLFGVVIGFLTGVYIPIGYYPDVIRSVIGGFPLTIITALIRESMGATSLTKLSQGNLQVEDSILTMFGIKAELFQMQISQLQYFFYLAIIIVGMVLWIWGLSKINTH